MDMRWPIRVPRRLWAALSDDDYPVRRGYAVQAPSAWEPADAVRRGASAGNFWDELGLAERQAFRSLAEERTFARGARLMQERGRADFVMLILDGCAQITVEDGGFGRVVAERGPGQLVGERAALELKVRSATVTVIELVHALVMSTEEFASFLSEYPSVLDLVEAQIYGRLTEESVGRQPALRPLAPLREPVPQAARRPRGQSLVGENCTVLRTDIVGFGALDRSERDRRVVRQASQAMIREALGSLWDSCLSGDRGDGLLIVVPPEAPTAIIVERLHRELPGKLLGHNRVYSEQSHIRLRVAVDVGPIEGDAQDLSGGSLIHASRLIEAPSFKAAMAKSGAVLGIIVSAFVYDTAVRPADRWLGRDAYRPVAVSVKEFKADAWMRLI